MSAIQDPVWGSGVTAVLDATSVEAAQLAASTLIDEAVPGGAAVDPSSRALVELLAGPDVRLASSRYRAYALAILLAMGTWVRTWRRAASSNPALAGSAIDEAEIERALAEFCSGNMALLDDPDDETRSLMSVLAGCVGEAPQVAGSLIARYEREDSPVVQAFIAQGLLRLLGRQPEAETAEVATIVSQILALAPSEVLARANHELRGGWWTSEERERLRARASVPAFSGEPQHWPAEGV